MSPKSTTRPIDLRGSLGRALPDGLGLLIRRGWLHGAARVSRTLVVLFSQAIMSGSLALPFGTAFGRVELAGHAGGICVQAEFRDPLEGSGQCPATSGG